MKKTIFIFCLMFWTFAAGSYSQGVSGKAAGAVYMAAKGVNAALNYEPPIVPPNVPYNVTHYVPSIPPRPALVPQKIPSVSVSVPVTVYDTIIRKDLRPRVDTVTGRVVYDTVEYPYVIASVKWVDLKSRTKEAGAETGGDTLAAAVDTPSVSVDTSNVPPAISSVNPPKERKTVSLLENDMPPWGWLLVAVIVILGVYTYGCCRSTEKEKEAQRRQEAARKSEEKREDEKPREAPETQPRRQPSPKAPSAAKNEKPSGTLYVDSKGVVRKKIEE